MLQTLSLRANVMYGEGDPYYITNGLRNARYSNGSLYQIGNGTALFQPVYVGNTAWAFICAGVYILNISCIILFQCRALLILM